MICGEELESMRDAEDHYTEKHPRKAYDPVPYAEQLGLINILEEKGVL